MATKNVKATKEVYKTLIEERRNLRAHFLYGLSKKKQARVREIEAEIDRLDRDIYSKRVSFRSEMFLEELAASRLLLEQVLRDLEAK